MLGIAIYIASCDEPVPGSSISASPPAIPIGYAVMADAYTYNPANDTNDPRHNGTDARAYYTRVHMRVMCDPDTRTPTCARSESTAAGEVAACTCTSRAASTHVRQGCGAGYGPLAAPGYTTSGALLCHAIMNRHLQAMQ